LFIYKTEHGIQILVETFASINSPNSSTPFLHMDMSENRKSQWKKPRFQWRMNSGKSADSV